MGQQATSWPGEHAPLPFCERRFYFFSDALGVITVHSILLPAPQLVRPEYADFFLMLQADIF